jgi:predicted RNase H-like HicB family nuclease
MKPPRSFTAIIEREEDGFVSRCPELDIASQGVSIEEARENLIEALTLFLETADPSEISRRLRHEVFVTPVGVPVG